MSCGLLLRPVQGARLACSLDGERSHVMTDCQTFNSNRNYEVSSSPAKKADAFDFMDQWYPIQVKQKDKAGRPDIDSFEAMMTRENRTKGFFKG